VEIRYASGRTATEVPLRDGQQYVTRKAVIDRGSSQVFIPGNCPGTIGSDQIKAEE